jgi:hypothetical protein
MYNQAFNMEHSPISIILESLLPQVTLIEVHAIRLIHSHHLLVLRHHITPYPA